MYVYRHVYGYICILCMLIFVAAFVFLNWFCCTLCIHLCAYVYVYIYICTICICIYGFCYVLHYCYCHCCCSWKFAMHSKVNIRFIGKLTFQVSRFINFIRSLYRFAVFILVVSTSKKYGSANLKLFSAKTKYEFTSIALVYFSFSPLQFGVSVSGHKKQCK